MDANLFREALGRFASGVTVITTRSPEGLPVGFTATAFSSLSLHPPLVLFCLGHDSTSLPAFREAPAFAIHVLDADQEGLSVGFARSGGDKFAGIAFTSGRHGVPILAGCLVILECRTRERLPGGDHTIFVGEVETARVREGAPLIYYRGAYRALAEPPKGGGISLPG